MNPAKLTLFLSVTALSLFACSEQNTTTSEPDRSISEQKEEIYNSGDSNSDHYLRLVERAEPTWAGISYTSPTGATSTDYIAEIEDLESLQFIVDEMIEGSNREPGIVDMSQPYYDLKMEYADGSEELLHLWITKDDSRGTLMDAMDTHYIYTFPNEVSERFLSFLPEEAILDTPSLADWIDGMTFGLRQTIEPSLVTDIDTLISYSEFIVQGRYTCTEPSDVPESWGDDSMAYYSFEVTDILKGDLDIEEIEVGQPDNIITWVRNPETGEDLGTVVSKNPFVSQPDPEKEVILFLSMQNEPGEFWRFSEPTMVEVLDDGSLRSVSSVFEQGADFSESTETHVLEDGWEVELTLVPQVESDSRDDPFGSITREELINDYIPYQ